MQKLANKSLCAAAFRMVILTLLINMSLVWQAWALTPKGQYHRAENAYATLKKNPRHQKYRDKWLACIEKYQNVYRLDPSGPWAAAGLYKSGLLYLQLHKRSYLDADRQEAVDAFQRVIQRFPKSRYTPKSRLQLADLGKPAAPPKKTVAARHLKKAHAAYKQLMGSAAKQKYRDQWEKCIDRFQVVYRSDTSGPDAAESLYMIGMLYKGLSDKSHRDADLDTAMGYFRRLKRQFPGSTFADKAGAELVGIIPTGTVAKTDDDDPLAGIIAKNKTDSDAGFPDAKVQRTGLVTVHGLRFWSNPSYTRIVIDADQETRFSHRLLKKDPAIKKPQRLYIDLSKSRLGKDIQKFVPINDELLSDARAGQYTGESVRIVVDIKSFKNYKIFSLKNPFRIVLDVWGADSDRQVAGKSASPWRPSTGKLPPGAIARQLALGVSRIVIDPGHGGKDYGAPGYLKGVHEKHVVLQIAKRLARKVETELKCDAVLTRTTDRYLTLEERTAIANTQNADLFISIHTNAVRNKRAYGIETFFLNLATDDDAILVAARENATSAKNISDLESILNDLMQNSKINESSRLAAMVQAEMCLHLRKNFSHIRSKGVKQAPFYVLLGAQMPAVLVETSFISNPRECKRLTSAKYQDELCDGIIRGIRKYIKETSPTAFIYPSAERDKKG
ncbi:MAG: N-acetylmuramoyl-L-alanine amidase [Desulfosarcina sp.]|nr:N-acetylmuramoyl-L-alanine amidase [Desulfosarcina sp.]MBC2741683.1 N-acetylmuramoyl-L-alanine amidase [Desulfosarcina sp.]MBC2764597.1 tetratricopeptide repeat protein [Desulfosarcina sp.]